MPERACQACGHPNPLAAKFCAGCGAVMEAGPKTDPAPAPLDAKNRTMMEFQAADSRAGLGPGPNPVPAQAPPAPLPAAKKTMVGISASEFLPKPAPAPAPAPAPLKNTMLGVAIPGIAPTQSQPEPAHVPGSRPVPNASKTMLGVATPGIAPTHEPAPSAPAAQRPVLTPLAMPPPPPVDIVPAPPPLVHDEPAPAAPVVVKKRGGIPLAVVAVVVGVLLLGGGAVLLLLMRGGTPLSAKAESTPDGKDALHLRCERCDDGTTAELNGMKATFAQHEAMLPLAVPLHVGDNPVALHVNRPGMGRDETVQLVVPIGYRVRADLSTLDAPRPAITVRVEAKPGTDVQIDGKPLALDPGGSGAYAIDIATETEGAAEKTRTLSKEIPYVITQKGGQPEKGKVVAQVNVLPLVLFTPGTHAVTDQASVLVSGQAVKGSTVTVNGQPAVVGPQGVFEATVATDKTGDVPIEVRTQLSSYAPRTARFAIKRVDKLADEAKAVESASPAGYDATLADIAGKTGQPFIADGEVEEAKVSQHRTIVVMNDRRGCAKGPCLLSVVIGHEEPLSRGDALKVYGRVRGSITRSDGKTVPEVEADFVIRGKSH